MSFRGRPDHQSSTSAADRLASPSAHEDEIHADGVEGGDAAIPQAWRWDAQRFESECARVNPLCDVDLLINFDVSEEKEGVSAGSSSETAAGDAKQ